MTALLIAFTAGCPNPEPEGVIKSLIDPSRSVASPLYYWETHHGKTAVYRIMQSTSDINTILHGLDGVLDLKSSKNAIYILRNDKDGNLALTRLEHDRTMTTDATLSMEIKATTPKPWSVSRNDVVAVAGVDRNGTNHVLAVTFERKEAETTFRPGEHLVPTVSHSETEWFSAPLDIAGLSIAADGSRLALRLALDDGSGGYGLFFVDGPGKQAMRIGDLPLVELGGFSQNGKWYVATFEYPQRIDVFLINTETLKAEPVTRVATGYLAGHPAWHPNSRYFVYTTNFTTEYLSGDTPLSGDQLYLFSVDSMKARRLTAFKDTALWVDFSPVGDFLLYASNSSAVTGTGDTTGLDSRYETWRMSYVPWIPDNFMSSNPRIMTPREMQFLVSWASGGGEVIGFAWGPGGD